MPQHTPELLVQFTKRADGAVVLRCARADGSATWQRQEGRNAFFFPFHDLTHFAVETALGCRQGFYGLLADGWDIADTGGQGARGRLPAEALLVEHVVGLLERSRVGGAAPLSAAEFNALLGELADAGRVERVQPLTDAQLDDVRARTEALHRRFAELVPGQTLELSFDRRPSAHDDSRRRSAPELARTSGAAGEPGRRRRGP